VTNPRSPAEGRFPFTFEKNGRTGKIYRLTKSGRFKSYFWYAASAHQDTFKTFEITFLYLERKFLILDANRANSLALNPFNGSVREYSELEQLCREKGGGASLREAVNFFIACHPARQFDSMSAEQVPQEYSRSGGRVMTAQQKDELSLTRARRATILHFHTSMFDKH
jgi:hypothetical protein